MKKKLILVLPAVLGLVIFLATYQAPKTSPINRDGASRSAPPTASITMLESTIPVDSAIAARVRTILEEEAPARGVFKYAITGLTIKSGYYYVSVAGMPMEATAMHLKDAVWLGTVQLANVATMPGLVTEVMSSQPVKTSQTAVNPGRGGAGNILPFRSGTQAQYGISAVHNCGFSLTGWKAVDLFPAENMIYSSMAGEINYICRDATQVAIRIGDNLYTHLADGGQQVGDKYTQGQPISGMVLGTFSDTCGVSDQGAQAYHVHFCFVPDNTGFFHADDYTLNTATGTWNKGQETINPLGYLTANWVSANVISGPAAGGNIWDSTVGGVTSMAQHTAAMLPVHTDFKMAETVLGNAGPAFDLIYTVILGNFDLTVPLWVIGIVTALELVRIGYAAWLWVKKAIPIIG